MSRVDILEAREQMAAALASRGFSSVRAALCAALFAEATLDGVYTHGLERFPRFVSYVEKGWVRAEAEPLLVSAFGAWGALGMGVSGRAISMPSQPWTGP